MSERLERVMTAREVVHSAQPGLFCSKSIESHSDACNRLVAVIERDRDVQRRETLRYLAAYLLDRGDQQDTDGGKWVPLADAAHAIAEGEFEAAWKHGEIDEGDVLERVDRWFARREPSTETAAASGTTRRTPQKERAR